MAEFSLDIDRLLQKAFGFGRGEPFDSSKINERNPVQSAPFDNVPILPRSEGTEFINVRDSLNAKLPTGQPIFMPMRLGGLLLPNEPSVSINGKKRIVETPLTGSKRRGTVKELIAIEDYVVTIRGVSINYQSKQIYPQDEVKGLHDLFLRNESLKVESALTNLFGIYRLVIRSVRFPEIIGVQHAQPYEFNCVSDEDFFLTLE